MVGNVLVLAVAALAAATAQAEFVRGKESDWNSVSGLKAGTRIEVVHGNFKRSTGALTGATPDGITLTTGAGEVMVSRAEVKRISTASLSRKKRTLIGLAVGSGGMAIAAAIGAQAGDIDIRRDVVVGAAALAGGSVGAAIGAISGGPRTLYRAP